MIPGANVLNMAFRAISTEIVTYFEDAGRVQNDIGQDITGYVTGINVRGSFQPVPRKLYEQLGLDLQKSYFNLYVPNNVIDVGRDVSGDQISFQGQRFQCESATEWFGIDGWVAVLCVMIPNVVVLQPIFGFNMVTEYPLTENANQNFSNGNFAGGID
jgi:hypothetical protein